MDHSAILSMTISENLFFFREMESSESDVISELAEASHTMYIRNRWVTDNSGEMQYSIVAPCLPGSGNYSDYNDWGKSLLV